MNKRIISVLLLLTVVALIGVPGALASESYLNTFNTTYPDAIGSRIDNCSLCHVNPDPINQGDSRNLYGLDFAINGHIFTAIESSDSDVDGFNNIDEIHNLTYPGNASDFPMPASIVVSPFTVTMTSGGTQLFIATARNQNNIPMPGINITWASNETAVGNVTPVNVLTNVSGMATTTFTASAAGTAMITAINNTVAGRANVTVTDATLPVITNVTLNTTTPVTGQTILVSVNATDNVAVTNVTANGISFVLQGGSLWNGTITASIGTNSVNVSARDAAGNIAWNNATGYTSISPPVTSFLLTPQTSVVLKGTIININITARNGVSPQPLFNGMANIIIEANNVSAISAPVNVSFVNGNATIQVNSSIAQFVTVTATSSSATGRTIVEFADMVISLTRGYNLISIPSFANPSDITPALQLVQNNGVQSFNPATGLFITPTDLQPLYGYWINVTADNQKLGFIADTSAVIVPPTRNLYEGWNLVGVSANKNEIGSVTPNSTFVDLRNGDLPSQWLYSRLVSFDEGNGRFTTYTAGVDLTLDSPPLVLGHGHWLFIKGMPNTNKNNVPWAGKLW